MTEPHDPILGMKLELAAIEHDRDTTRRRIAVDLLQVALENRRPSEWIANRADIPTLETCLDLFAETIVILTCLNEHPDLLAEALIEDAHAHAGVLTSEMHA